MPLAPLAGRCLLFLGLLAQGGLVLAQSAPEPQVQQPIRRDVWMMLIKSALANSCDNPILPPACLAKTQDICRKYLPVAFERCERTLSGRMPVEIKPDEARQWSGQLSRCVVNNFVMLAGAGGLDMTKCPTRKP